MDMKVRSSDEVTPNMPHMRQRRENLASPCTGNGFCWKLKGAHEFTASQGQDTFTPGQSKAEEGKGEGTKRAKRKSKDEI